MSLPPDPNHEGVFVGHLWRVDEAPGDFAVLAHHWHDLSHGLADAGEQASAAGRTLHADWDATSAQAYQSHLGQLTGALAAVSSAARTISDRLGAAAGIVASAQEELDHAWVRLARHGIGMRAAQFGLVLYPSSDRERAIVAAAVEQASQIRSRADSRLTALADWLAGVAIRVPNSLADANEVEWTSWSADPESTVAGQILVDGDRVIVNGTGAADRIDIAEDPLTGERIVTIDAITRRLSASSRLIVRAGAGDDTITVSPGSTVRVTVLGGDGRDDIRGGDGDEVLLGQWGADTILAGDGADVVSAGTGTDYVDGQAGDDIIDGGGGTDTLYGLTGRDILLGGADEDYLDGGTGEDALIAGAGRDILTGGRDADRVIGDRLDTGVAQADDVVRGGGREITVELTDVGGFIQVEGSPEFVARVQSDLDTLRGTPRGAAMLEALQRSHDESRSVGADWPLIGPLFGQGNTLVIREIDGSNGFAHSMVSPLGPVHAVIDYSPTFDELVYSPPVPPVVVLYHELAHVYDAFYGTSAEGTYTGSDNPGVPNSEREAVGLPIDHDADPATMDQIAPAHPFPLTENGFRDELGLNPRQRY